MDNQSGYLTFDTSKVLVKSTLSFDIVVGSQTISKNAAILLEVIDCIKDLTFAQGLSVQMGAQKQELMGAMNQNQISSHQDFCSGGQYLLTSADGS